MPGPYAHITLLHELMQPDNLENIFSPTSGIITVLPKYFSYCVLGAVSPDYPNLASGDCTASAWADAMHTSRVCEMIACGIEQVRNVKGSARNKQLAWLLGYCSHVVADVTIHPVVQAKVGVYAENQRQHRICEMNQDSYIFRRMNLGEIGESDHYAESVWQCGDHRDRTQLNRDIVNLWQNMFADVHPELFFTHLPDPSAWHREFVAMAERCKVGSLQLFPLAGVIAAKMELAYPAYDTVDSHFTEEQIIPSETPFTLHYDEIFDHAVANVASVWSQVEQAVYADTDQLHLFGDWNLDTGRDEHGALVFWE